MEPSNSFDFVVRTCSEVCECGEYPVLLSHRVKQDRTFQGIDRRSQFCTTGRAHNTIVVYEIRSSLISVRTLNGKDLGSVPLTSFIERLRVELESRGRQTLEG
jgi:hypothetical protein